MPAHPQLPLSIGLKDSALFGSFVAGDNAELLAHLRRCAVRDEPAGVSSVYLWGDSGRGKSHLLQAVCHAAGARGEAAFYLPLRAAAEFPLDALQGLESMAAVCVDDVDAVVGDERWEQGLLALFDRLQTAGRLIVVTGRRPPADLGVDPSLASRLSWGLTFQLKPLSAAGRRAALRLRAERRGLKLGEDAARLLVRHAGDDIHALFDQLEQLDRASLAAKRRLSRGFIIQTLGLEDTD